MDQHRNHAGPDQKIRCDACPVLCYIANGKAGACDRYANENGQLVRVDPLTIIEQCIDSGQAVVPFFPNTQAQDWNGDLVRSGQTFVTAVGAGTTYPDYKPAPFIVSQDVAGVDMVTVVTEGIFSYCSTRVKIDTDRFVGNERAIVRASGQPVGHVTTAEYGSQMLSIGGVNHLTGGDKKEGRQTCETLVALCNRQEVELDVDGGAHLTVQAGEPPTIDGVQEKHMRVGCGSATIGMFARDWAGLVDEVVVVDDHITGVLSEHQAGKLLDVAPTGIKILGHRSTPGRYFRVANSGSGWGGTDIEDPLSILGPFKAEIAWPGLRLLMVSTTGEQFSYFELDEQLVPAQKPVPPALQQSAKRIEQNCEPSITSVMFVAGAGGSLRSGVTQQPRQLTQSVKQMLTHVTCAGAPAYVWPGGGIKIMVDVSRMPANAFGSVPTPAVVAPIEFTLRVDDYRRLGGHMESIERVENAVKNTSRHLKVSQDSWPPMIAKQAWQQTGNGIE